MGKILHFQQLEVWQEAHKLTLLVYKITKAFPSEEKFGLVSQMRRAAVSIPANIVEGFKRRGSRDKLRFYNIAEGSLEEVKYFFILSKDLNYISATDELITQAEAVGRLLNDLITSVERRP